MSNYPVTEYDINLSVLQQKDPYILSIADTASQVAAYSFNSSTNGWEKTNIEGTLFVYTRSAVPVNGFMIINRLHLQDLIEPINKNLEFQLQDPFLLYKDSRNESICGIWFYDRDECARIGQLMNSLVQVARETHDEEQSRQRRASESDTSMVERFSGDSFNAIHAASSQKQNIDILQLLSKAQDEYDKMLSVKGTYQHQSTNGDATLLSHVRSLRHESSSSNKPQHIGNIASSSKSDAFETLAFSQTQPASNVQHPTATHISLETLFKRASLQNRDNKLADQKFANVGGPNSAFHLPPPPLPTLATPTVEEIEKAHRENVLVNSASSGKLGSGGSAVAGSGGSSRNDVVIRCGSDSSFSEISCEGSSLNASRAKGKSESELDLKELHMQLMGQGHHKILESPNTALKRTLNIAPLTSVSSKQLPDYSQACRNEKPFLQQPLLKEMSTTNKQTTTNTLVQALFLREQQQRLLAQQAATSQSQTISSSEQFNVWNNKTSFPSAPKTFSDVLSSTTPALSKLISQIDKEPQDILPVKAIPKTSSPKLSTHSSQLSSQNTDLITTSVSTAPQLINKQRQITRPVADMLSKPNNFLSVTKTTGPSPVPATTLLSPMVFQTARNNVISQKLSASQQSTSVSTQNGTLVSTLLAPLTTHQLHTSANNNHIQRSNENDDLDKKDTEVKLAPLTKEQLKQALISLLKNDVQFLTAIHEAYTTSLNRGLTSHN